jgi:hypothetical protein
VFGSPDSTAVTGNGLAVDAGTFLEQVVHIGEVRLPAGAPQMLLQPDRPSLEPSQHDHPWPPATAALSAAARSTFPPTNR